MSAYTIRFQDIDKTSIAIAGGKGAGLGALCKIEGINVPKGFCISTKVFSKVVDELPLIRELFHRLTLLKVTNRAKIRAIGDEIRSMIETVVISEAIVQEIGQKLDHFSPNTAYAVRSSATAEDLPTVSFAGQQDTYLNITGKEAVLKHICKCWASLFTERAITYRIQNGFDHRQVYMAVVVQEMVFPDVAGILFTADPVTSNRKILSIDASYGLGESLVSGIVNADTYKVHNGRIVDKRISVKKQGIYAIKDGGTEAMVLDLELQGMQALQDSQILELEALGRKIEGYFGQPQDIEWCLAGHKFHIVQSRPITTLYPIPATNDNQNHVYLSVGHQQMMTDAMKPLGLSMWRLTPGRPMYQAGGRLFVDVAPDLASPERREIFINVLGKSDPLIKAALITILEREDFIQCLPDNHLKQTETTGKAGPPPMAFQTLNDYNPEVVTALISNNQAEIKKLKQDIELKSGTDLFDFILEDIERIKKGITDPQSFGVIMTAMNAASWINEHMEQWLGEKGVADKLAQSVANNVTSEMGLALLDVADAIRPYPEIVSYLTQAKDEHFLDKLGQFDGGEKVYLVIRTYLDKYGMRCAGEIDITRPRWSEKPATLIPLILSNLRNFKTGESKRKFEQGLQEAIKKEKELLERLKQLPDGEAKVNETKRMIGLIRNFAGYREYPKYGIVSRYFSYKQALMKAAEQLVQARIIHEKEDVYYLTFEEFREAVQTQKLDDQLIISRKAEYLVDEKLMPPRVFTSDGEVIRSAYKHENLPDNAIAGLAVSSGIVEGRARVILKMEEADLEEDDILITPFTDPSWTPLFVSVKGLVTEVGGLMTHGAVIAREYGLPAVVGVENATKLIKDGQKIRLNGTDGYIELL